MITLKVDAAEPDAATVRAAADAIRRGELVIFPTETVYGLAADALNENAVRLVFRAKGRADKQPLPVQVAGVRDVPQVAEYMPDRARLLAERYWPGPLTLVLPKSGGVLDVVTGGEKTVAIRVPDHPVAMALLRELGSPIVATSANVSGDRPPTTAVDAVRQVGDSVSVVLDGGESRLGISSTVVDVSTAPPRLLRRGTIGADEIRAVLGELVESAD